MSHKSAFFFSSCCKLFFLKTLLKHSFIKLRFTNTSPPLSRLKKKKYWKDQPNYLKFCVCKCVHVKNIFTTPKEWQNIEEEGMCSKQPFQYIIVKFSFPLSVSKGSVKTRRSTVAPDFCGHFARKVERWVFRDRILRNRVWKRGKQYFPSPKRELAIAWNLQSYSKMRLNWAK